MRFSLLVSHTKTISKKSKILSRDDFSFPFLKIAVVDMIIVKVKIDLRIHLVKHDCVTYSVKQWKSTRLGAKFPFYESRKFITETRKDISGPNISGHGGKSCIS